MKFIKTIILTIAIIVMIPSPSHAEHSIGFAAGSTRGLGATYRYLPDQGDASPWGWQVTGLPFITEDEGTVSLGGALLYRLHQGREAMAFASFGLQTARVTSSGDTYAFAHICN